MSQKDNLDKFMEPIINIPNFRPYGYVTLEHLFTNYAGCRASYKAKDISTGDIVFIKHFRFGTGNQKWSGYKYIEKETETLARLDHEGIPKLLASKETDDGFILVTEYIDGVAASKLNLTTVQIVDLIERLLKICIYLQKFNPPIVHRDIKPENILVSKDGDIYLVDFGIAVSRFEQAGASTMFAGTHGFIPPEGMFARTLGKSSDIYSIAGTFLVLLVGESTSWLGSVFDESGNIKVGQHLQETEVSKQVVKWISRNLSKDPRLRYGSAEDALKSLKGISLAKSSLPHVGLKGAKNTVLKVFRACNAKWLIVGGCFVVTLLLGIVVYTNLPPETLQGPLPETAIENDRFFDEAMTNAVINSVKVGAFLVGFLRLCLWWRSSSDGIEMYDLRQTLVAIVMIILFSHLFEQMLLLLVSE